MRCVYGPCLNYRDTRRIQVVQNACLRLVFGVRRRQPVSHKLKLIAWLNMELRRTFHFGCLLHTILLNKTPPYLYNKIKFRTDIHNVNIRRKDMLCIPKHKLTLYRKSFTYQASKIYNLIPTEIKELPSRSFRNRLRQLLLNR